MALIWSIFTQSWHLLEESSVFVLFGLGVAGLLRVFLPPQMVTRHLGRGRVGPVFKAALLGLPLPLCSCGVLPAAAGLKRQGANNGATVAFLISTPESGVDSIALTYALIDPIMAVARPVAAFFAAVGAGLAENLTAPPKKTPEPAPKLACLVDGCHDGADCPPEEHAHTLTQKIRAGLGFALGELWSDLAGWFLVGLLLAGVISALVPPQVLGRYLDGGIVSMLIMLAAGVPLYVCATASTPIAAALILKGVSPGAALVFLLAGPATNAASLTVLTGLLGKRATAIYLVAIAATALVCGLALDQVYQAWGLSAQAAIGQANDFIPAPLGAAGAIALLALSARPVYGRLAGQYRAVFGGAGRPKDLLTR